jgi:hypothetical protein
MYSLSGGRRPARKRASSDPTLATLGGRTSDPAAVRGDAGSDHAAAGTDGDNNQVVVESASEWVLKRVGEGEVLK